MSYYGLADGTSLSSFFSSSSYSRSSSNSSISFLSDYASIKNGSYYKLMKAYYGGNDKISPLVSSTATSKESAKKLTAIESGADDLKEVADELYNGGTQSVFKQVDIKQEDGTTKKGYDVDAIYKKVDQFVESYNDMLESTEDVDSDSLERAAKNLKNVTNSNAKNLADIGITVKSDGSLKLDEETFRKTDMSKVKDLFNGTGSYGYQVSARASMIDYAAEREAAKANTYNRYGSYNSNYNYSYNSYIQCTDLLIFHQELDNNIREQYV